MMENLPGASFPVVFFDGEREIDIGSVLINPSMDFKNFQLFLSQKIGISPQQITVYLVDVKKEKSFVSGSRRKIPITGKVFFPAIARVRNGCFLVVLKRSRRERRRKNRHNFQEYYQEDFDYDYDYDYTPLDSPPQSMTMAFNHPHNVPENIVLLRRNPDLTANQQLNGIVSQYYNQIPATAYLPDYGSRVMELQAEREKYLKMVASDANTLSKLKENYTAKGTIDDGVSNDGCVCEECQSKEMKENPEDFHLCAGDPVTFGFRTLAGPIARPFRRSD